MGCGLSTNISYDIGRKDASFVGRVGYPAIANLRRTGERPVLSLDFPRFGSAPPSITEYSSSVGRTSQRSAVRGLTPFPGLLLRWLALRVRAILPVSDRDFVAHGSLCALLICCAGHLWPDIAVQRVEIIF